MPDRKIRMVRRSRRRVQAQVVIGLDLSLSGTGVAVMKDGKVIAVRGWTKVRRLQKQHSGTLCWYNASAATESNRVHRLDEVMNWMTSQVLEPALASGAGEVFIAVEGYAFSRQGAGHTDTHGLGESVKLWAFRNGIPVRVYTPSQVKKALTGSGKADKADMKVAIYKLWQSGSLPAEVPLDFTVYEDAGENLADASALAYLLTMELAARDGRSNQPVPPRLKKYLFERTKKEEAPVRKPFLHSGEVTAASSIYAMDELTFK